ncbi:alginate lyase family protein [Microbulbifer rhizosphaerae]|uniref:Alginate lyase domain-containing protein n=1 Tax=Microbulbifer rhizosphaerae TaxID=1562603 RepID=A0A7W4WFC3_9GAMM|nr:alginate lyase family protein [Microbulbifer rhizosphaerae]MBB3063183.1 hypothetical protein [Microbulbifer rhizosphaerae]
MKNILLPKLRSITAIIPGALYLRQKLRKMRIGHNVHVIYPKYRKKHTSFDANLADQNSSLVNDCIYKPDTFVLYRIIGNDLVPRHKKGQSRENLVFILTNEPELQDCEKRFIVNRIVDLEEEKEIIQLLENFGMPYLCIPFDWEAYRCQPWDIWGVPPRYSPHSKLFSLLEPSRQNQIQMRLYRHKNNYVMHNNGARNIALRDGRRRAKWILPWDGNCFVTTEAWESIRSAVVSRPEIPYYFTPMARVIDNRKLLQTGFQPPATEEPQLLFRCDSKLEFDPEYFYGRRPKVELFWRLGIPGKWEYWPVDPWDLPCPDYAKEAGQFAEAGWVARLFSGQAKLEKQNDQQAWVGRGEARMEAIAGFLGQLDECAFKSRLNPEEPVFINGRDSGKVAAPMLMQLRNAADEALDRGPYSVVDKQTLAPSGNPHDYWHPAPYYWPNPSRIPGLPYVRRDGRRVPGTRMYEPLSENYDRTRLQHLFDDTYILMLACRGLGEECYGKHAAKLVRHWFLNPETMMNPHLKYAQVRRGHNNNLGASPGIIEMKDLYYFLDAVRLLWEGNLLSHAEYEEFKLWLDRYLYWLRSSEQGRGERAALNNHGTYYDLQVASICTFLGKQQLLRETLCDSRFRIIEQFDSIGRQPREMERATTAHYCCFNLQGWIHLAQLAESVGEDLWGFEGPDGQCIRKAMEWLLGHVGKPWPYKQIDEFDSERFSPIYYIYRSKYGMSDNSFNVQASDLSQIKPLFFPHDGIRPFWNYNFPEVCASKSDSRKQESVAL